MPPPKHHHCKDCSTTDPQLFYPKCKSRCKACTSKRNLSRLEENPSAKQLNRERAAQWQRGNPARFKWLQAKSRAKRKGLEFSITEADVVELYNKQGGLCAYTGLQMPMRCCEDNLSVSIDRVDSSRGYTLDNIVLCCCIVNVMKNDLSLEEFRDIVNLLHAHIQ